MARLGALIGIGLMLVGALAYTLTETQDWVALLPGFAGVIIGAASVASMYSEASLNKLVHVNAAASLLLVVFAASRIVPDALKLQRGRVAFISDVDVLGLAMVFLFLCLMRIIKARQKKGGAKLAA